MSASSPLFAAGPASVYAGAGYDRYFEAGVHIDDFTLAVKTQGDDDEGYDLVTAMYRVAHKPDSGASVRLGIGAGNFKYGWDKIRRDPREPPIGGELEGFDSKDDTDTAFALVGEASKAVYGNGHVFMSVVVANPEFSIERTRERFDGVSETKRSEEDDLQVYASVGIRFVFW